MYGLLQVDFIARINNDSAIPVLSVFEQVDTTGAWPTVYVCVPRNGLLSVFVPRNGYGYGCGCGCVAYCVCVFRGMGVGVGVGAWPTVCVCVFL